MPTLQASTQSIRDSGNATISYKEGAVPRKLQPSETRWVERMAKSRWLSTVQQSCEPIDRLVQRKYALKAMLPLGSLLKEAVEVAFVETPSTPDPRVPIHSFRS